MAGQNQRTKFLSASALTLGLVALGAQAAMAMDDYTTPTGEQVVGGQATFDRPDAGVLNINQGTNRVVINWDSFNIGAKGKTEFFQPNSGSLAVNRVTGQNADPTQILGTLKANGRVMVLDRNGVFFGKGAVIDVGGIVASTGDVDNAAVLHGDDTLELSNFGDASVINEGLVRVGDAGLAAFVAPHVVNNGVIEARLGKVALASGGERATVDLYGDGLVEIAVDGQKTKALVENNGTIDAEGGTVLMTADAAKEVVDDVINVKGLIKVSSATMKGGKIILSGGQGGKVKVDGTLDASGENGGKIDVRGKDVDVGADAKLLADGRQNGDGGDVVVYADNNTIFRGSVFARGGTQSGNGGFVEVSAKNEVGYDGSVSTLAVNGISGNFLIDPLFAVIHSGVLNNTNFISSNKLANDLKNNASVTVQADNYIDVGTNTASAGVGTGVVDVSVGSTLIDYLPTDSKGNILSPSSPGYAGRYNSCNNGSSSQCVPNYGPGSITTGDLTLQSALVNFNKDLIMGTGDVTVNASQLNLNSKLYGRSTVGGATTLLNDVRLIGTGALNTITVVSPNALINQGIQFADDAAALTTINVGAGIYAENVTVNKGNVTLKGAASHGSVIQPPGGFSLRVLSANDVTIDGFNVAGVAGVSIQNAKSTTLQNNRFANGILVDNGDNLTIKGNIFNLSGPANKGVYVSDTGSAPAEKSDFLTVTENAFNGGGDAINLSTGTGNATITNNFFSNWSDAAIEVGSGTTYGNVNIFNNSFVSVTGSLVENIKAGSTVKASGNYWGSVSESAINVRMTGSVDFTPYLALSTDTSAAAGFQGDFSNLYVTTKGAQTQVGGRINEAIGLLNDGSLTGTNRTIHVLAGTYNESVNVSKAATLLGAQAGFAGNAHAGLESIVDPNSPGFYVTADGVVIDGFTVDTGDDGVLVENADNVNVTNTIFKNQTANAVRSTNGADNVNVTNNAMVLNSGVTGVSLSGGSNHDVTGNVINGGYRGVVLSGTGSGNNVLNNTIGQTTGTSDNAVMVFGNTGTTNVNGNHIYNTGWDGVNVQSGTGFVTIQGNDIHNTTGASGIAIMFHNGDALVDNNVIDGADRLGVYVWNSNGLDITNNKISDTGREAGWWTAGIHLEGANSTTVSGNQINKTGGDAIAITGGNSGLVATSGNQVLNNTIGTLGGVDNIKGDGVYANASNGVVIQGNTTTQTHSTAFDKGSGIQVVNSSGAVIGGAGALKNTITNSGWDGIRLQNDTGAMVEGNKIDGVERVGIYAGSVTDSTIKNNIVKNTNLADYGAISTDFGSNLTITGNDVDFSKGSGIRVNTAGGTNLIDNNKVDNVDQDGIRAESTAGLTISNNQIGKNGGNVDRDGIFVTASNAARILSNRLSDIGQDGIFAQDSNDLEITLNEIKAAGSTSEGAHNRGIYVTGGTSALIEDNQIIGGDGAGGSTGKKGAGLDAIYVNNNNGVEIIDNTVKGGNGKSGSGNHGGSGAGSHGIYIANSQGATVKDNDVLAGSNNGSRLGGQGANLSGIYAVDNKGNFSFKNGIYVGHNVINGTGSVDSAGDDGIYVENSGNASGGNAALIEWNQVKFTGEDGIDVRGTDNVQIQNNTVQDVAGFGIRLNPSHDAVIDTNFISATGDDGIHILFSNNVDVTNNKLHSIGGHGIYSESGNNLYVSSNTIGDGSNYGAKNDGIHVSGGENALIQSNIIQGSKASLSGFSLSDGTDGATLDGIHVENNDGVEILSNTVAAGQGFSVTLPWWLGGATIGADGGRGAGQNGVFVANSNGAVIDKNVMNGDLLGQGTGAGADGIHVENSNLLTVGGLIPLLNGNKIFSTGGDGINIDGSAGALVLNNIIGGLPLMNVGDDGIDMGHALGALVAGNIVTRTGGDGIAFANGALSGIGFNVITDAGDDGIDIEDSAFVAVGLNVINGADNNGIELSNSGFTLIGWNNVSDAGQDGINVSDSKRVDIRNNDVSNVDHDGIAVSGGNKIRIRNNDVTYAGNDGIYAGDMDGWNHGKPNVRIENNTVDWTGNNGIAVSNVYSSLIDSNKVGLDGGEYDESIGEAGILVTNESYDDPTVISNNLVANTDEEGIYVSGVADVTITDNTVWNTGEEGIGVYNAWDSVLVSGNYVGAVRGDIGGGFIDGDGINVSQSGSVWITDNVVEGTDDDGIDVSDDDEVRILSNTVSMTGDDGISANNIGHSFLPTLAALEEGEGDEETGDEDPYYALVIANNTITDAGQLYADDEGGDYEEESDFPSLRLGLTSIVDLGGDGIDVSNSASTLIDTNTVDRSYDDGIVVSGSDGGQTDFPFIPFNIFPGSGSSLVVVRNNDVANSGSDGIEVRNMPVSHIDANRILNSGANGFFASGMNNGDVVLTGNEFTDNPVGARFESGMIDLTGEANTFNNGVVGMQFDPATSFGITGFEEIFIPYGEGEGGFYMTFPVFGSVAADLNLVDDTIGETVFKGQSQYYVELKNGALFNPGTPTLLNGLNATYDGFRPANVGGILTQAQYDAIEAKIFHYNDLASLGLFFFGLVPDSDIQQEDIFNKFGGFSGKAGPIRITLLGLPNLPGNGGGVANFLANISPAAGGEEDEYETVFDLADVEPAAGGDSQSKTEDAACWSEAAAQASAGTSVSYSFGASAEESLSQEAGCSF